MRKLFLAVVTLFWAGLTPLRDELEEAGLLRLWRSPDSPSARRVRLVR
jgi:hypothetical protein